MAKSVFIFVGIAAGVLAGFSAGRFVTPADAAGTTAPNEAGVQVVRCTNESNGIPFDTSADDRWDLLSDGLRTFRSTHGKYFFAPENHECVVIAAPTKG